MSSITDRLLCNGYFAAVGAAGVVINCFGVVSPLANCFGIAVAVSGVVLNIIECIKSKEKIKKIIFYTAAFCGTASVAFGSCKLALNMHSITSFDKFVYFYDQNTLGLAAATIVTNALASILSLVGSCGSKYINVKQEDVELQIRDSRLELQKKKSELISRMLDLFALLQKDEPFNSACEDELEAILSELEAVLKDDLECKLLLYSKFVCLMSLLELYKHRLNMLKIELEDIEESDILDEERELLLDICKDQIGMVERKLRRLECELLEDAFSKLCVSFGFESIGYLNKEIKKQLLIALLKYISEKLEIIQTKDETCDSLEHVKLVEWIRWCADRVQEEISSM